VTSLISRSVELLLDDGSVRLATTVGPLRHFNLAHPRG
jgi:hypothetical protein